MSEYTEQHARATLDPPPLEVWPNQYPDREYEIVITAPEFTCVCPRTGLPDFAEIRVSYVPGAHCLELKAFKYYLNAFRNVGIFHENVVNRIRDDIIRAAAPRRLSVVGDFRVRGGLLTSVRADYTAPPGEDS